MTKVDVVRTEKAMERGSIDVRTETERLTERATTNRLTERGGVALVCFHLARLGYEYAVTEPACPFGDVWAHINGRKVAIEVKTTRNSPMWWVRRSQLRNVDFYCFVRLNWGHCYVLTAAEALDALAASPNIYEGIASLKDTTVPADSFKGWDRLSKTTRLRDKKDLEVRPLRKPGKPGKPKKPGKTERVVRRTMKDGTMREYRYPPYNSGGLT
jgi:hypothetical protein